MIAVYILLIVLLILLVLLLIPLNLRIILQDELSLIISYAFLKFKVLPTDEISKSKPATKKTDRKTKEKPQAAQERKPGMLSRLFEKETFADAVIELCELAKDLFAQGVSLFRKVTVQNLRLDILVGHEDAAETGIRFGRVCAAVYSLRAVAEGILKFKQSEVNIKPDFDHGQNSVFLDLHLRLIPILAIGPSLRMLIRFLKFYCKSKKDGVSK